MEHMIYLSLGTNQGDREVNLEAVQHHLPVAVNVLECSPIYETPPWGYDDQPTFLNQVVKGKTELSPEDLLNYLKAVEEKMGRVPTFRFGPRIIDIDILFYDELVFDNSNLVIPHPRLEGRAFVLVPLSDLAPDLRHTVLGKTVKELLNETDTSGISLYKRTNV